MIEYDVSRATKAVQILVDVNPPKETAMKTALKKALDRRK